MEVNKENEEAIDWMVEDAFEYCPETGEIRWAKTRPIQHFKTVMACNRWHTLFAGKIAGAMNIGGYVAVTFNYVQLSGHRIAWRLHYGKWPSVHLDHQDGNRQNNRIDNLREVTPLENSRNVKLQERNRSGRIGVNWCDHGNCWRAYIGTGQGQKKLGSFKTKEEAIAAREAAETKYGYHPNHGRES